MYNDKASNIEILQNWLAHFDSINKVRNANDYRRLEMAREGIERALGRMSIQERDAVISRFNLWRFLP